MTPGVYRRILCSQVIDSLRSETLLTKEERDRPFFFVHPLPAGTEFIVRAFAQNAKGRSDSDIFTASTEEARNSGDSESHGFSHMTQMAGLYLVVAFVAASSAGVRARGGVRYEWKQTVKCASGIE